MKKKQTLYPCDVCGLNMPSVFSHGGHYVCFDCYSGRMEFLEAENVRLNKGLSAALNELAELKEKTIPAQFLEEVEKSMVELKAKEAEDAKG